MCSPALWSTLIIVRGRRCNQQRVSSPTVTICFFLLNRWIVFGFKSFLWFGVIEKQPVYQPVLFIIFINCKVSHHMCTFDCKYMYLSSQEVLTFQSKMSVNLNGFLKVSGHMIRQCLSWAGGPLMWSPPSLIVSVSPRHYPWAPSVRRVWSAVTVWAVVWSSSGLQLHHLQIPHWFSFSICEVQAPFFCMCNSCIKHENSRNSTFQKINSKKKEFNWERINEFNSIKENSWFVP